MFDTWKNQPDFFESNGDIVTITAPGGTDYFNDPASEQRKANSPVYLRDVAGDFTIQARVSPAFAATYDAGALVFYCNDNIWMKLAYEQTDMGNTSVVTVVTNGLSDDANGEVVELDAIYLKMTRRGNTIGAYYSRDGKQWRMARLCSLAAPDKGASEPPAPEAPVCRVGVSAQSPTGSGCTVTFTELQFADHAVKDLRGGV